MRSGNRYALVAVFLLLLTPLFPVNAEYRAPVLAFAGLQYDQVAGIRQQPDGLGCDVIPVDNDLEASRGTDAPIRVAVTCFKSGERTSGMYKICYYDCLGSTVAITIDAVQLCPLTINR